MEWCRMFTLRIALWTVLLGCGLSFSVPDFRPDTVNSLTDRDRKLQELLRTLQSLPSEHLRPAPVAKQNDTESTESDLPDSEPNFPLSPDFRGRMSSREELPLPNEETFDSYQDYYRRMYGTQEGVNYLRKQFGPSGLKQARAKFNGVNRGMDDVRLANVHFLKIRNRARCKVPVPQVVRVKDYYPDPSKEYLPRCTLLHRCGDTTGCCDSDAFHCVPSAIQEITLHFYTLTVDKSGISYKSQNSVTKLLFQNHTACKCQPVNDLPRIQEDLHHLLDRKDSSSNSKCRDCPVPFTSRMYKDGTCGCDCFDRQRPCLRIKRGKERLTEIERRCVEANHCHIPACEYGEYSHETGYCPRRNSERPRNHHRRPNHHSSNHRWAYLERD